MKTILCILLLCGCGFTAFARLGDTEAQLVERHGRPSARYYSGGNLVLRWELATATNWAALSKQGNGRSRLEWIETSYDIGPTQARALLQHFSGSTNWTEFRGGGWSSPACVGSVGMRQVFVGLRDDDDNGSTTTPIPADVYRQIRAKARQDWPDNFQMQEWRIKKEMEAYQRLHPR